MVYTARFAWRAFFIKPVNAAGEQKSFWACKLFFRSETLHCAEPPSAATAASLVHLYRGKPLVETILFLKSGHFLPELH